MVSAKQPTIAVITAQYCEKIAVDAMLENKETFVRYTTVGKFDISHEVGFVCSYISSLFFARDFLTFFFFS